MYAYRIKALAKIKAPYPTIWGTNGAFGGGCCAGTSCGLEVL